MASVRDGKGYILPEIINPNEYWCIGLYVPKDMRYLEALSGQLHDLATWKLWEKDGTNRAAEAAAVWKDAIDETYNDLWLDGVIMTCAQVELLTDALLTINNTLTSGNNALIQALQNLQIQPSPMDCLPCEDRVFTPPTPQPNPNPLEPPVGGNPEGWADYLCRAANYLWYEHVEKGGLELVSLGALGEGLIGTGAVIAVMYATGIGAPIAFAVSIVAAVLAVLNIYDATEFGVILEDLAATSICAIVNSTGSETAVSNLRQSLVDNGATQQTIDYVMRVTGTNAMNRLFAGEIVVPDEFVAKYDCGQCGAPGAAVRVWQESFSMHFDVGINEVFEVPVSFLTNGYQGTNKLFLLLFQDLQGNNIEVSYDVLGWDGFTVATNPNNPLTAQQADINSQPTIIIPYLSPLVVFSSTNAFKVQLNSGQEWTVTMRITGIV